MAFTDPDIPYRYKLEIGGVSVAQFHEVQGLKSTTAIKSVREGGNNRYEASFIEGNKFDDLVVKKGFYSAGSEFWGWMRSLHGASPVTRVDMQLVMVNDAQEEVGRFSIYGAFPVEYEAPSFNSSAKEIAFEQIKIHYDFFEYHPGGAVASAIDAVIGAITNRLKV